MSSGAAIASSSGRRYCEGRSQSVVLVSGSERGRATHQSILLNVVDDAVGQEVLDTLASAHKQTYFGRRNVIVDCLFDNLEIPPVLPKQVVGEEERPDVGAGSLNDQTPVPPENVVQLWKRKASQSVPVLQV